VYHALAKSFSGKIDPERERKKTRYIYKHEKNEKLLKATIFLGQSLS